MRTHKIWWRLNEQFERRRLPHQESGADVAAEILLLQNDPDDPESWRQIARHVRLAEAMIVLGCLPDDEASWLLDCAAQMRRRELWRRHQRWRRERLRAVG